MNLPDRNPLALLFALAGCSAPAPAPAPAADLAAAPDAAAGPAPEVLIAAAADQPLLAAHPTRPGVLAIIDGSCRLYGSRDGGATWAPLPPPPRLTAESTCARPALAYAPDGARLYVAYVDGRTSAPREQTTEVAVSSLRDDGSAWERAAVVGLPSGLSNPGRTVKQLLSLGLAVPRDRGQPERVYLTAIYLEADLVRASHAALFTTSPAAGRAGTWAPPVTLDATSHTRDDPPPALYLSGLRPAGGLGAEVLVTWLVLQSDAGGAIRPRLRRSGDGGAGWDAVVDLAGEDALPPSNLGPEDCRNSGGWPQGADPALVIDDAGAAHLAYAVDPDGAAGREEAGDIRYRSAAGPPYRGWSPPVTVNDDGPGRAQGLAALHVDPRGAVWILWRDHRRSPSEQGLCPDAPTSRYDIFMARRAPGAAAFGENRVVTTASSVTGRALFPGVAVAGAPPFAVWTDRRGAKGVDDEQRSLYGAGLSE